MSKSKEDGGLGIRALKEMNLALLGKWLWRIGGGLEAFWKQVISSKYDMSRDGWKVRDPMIQSYGKCILASTDMFFKHIRYRVGKGD